MVESAQRKMFKSSERHKPKTHMTLLDLEEQKFIEQHPLKGAQLITSGAQLEVDLH